MTQPPGSPGAHLEWLLGKLHRQWEVLADATPDLTGVKRDGDTVRALLDGKPVVATIGYDE